MKINDDAPVPTIATQPLKLLWSTPRVVVLATELGTQGKPHFHHTEPTIDQHTLPLPFYDNSGPS